MKLVYCLVNLIRTCLTTANHNRAGTFEQLQFDLKDVKCLFTESYLNCVHVHPLHSLIKTGLSRFTVSNSTFVFLPASFLNGIFFCSFCYCKAHEVFPIKLYIFRLKRLHRLLARFVLFLHQQLDAADGECMTEHCLLSKALYDGHCKKKKAEKKTHAHTDSRPTH